MVVLPRIPFDVTLLDALAVAGAVVLYWSLNTYVRYARIAKAVDYMPGPRVFFSGATVVTRFLPYIPYINRPPPWYWKHSAFAQYGYDILANFTFWPSPRLLVGIADPDTVKEITTHHSAFPKPVKLYEPFNMFGANVITTEGERWRLHRKVVARSFSEQNHKVVWSETRDCVEALFATWDEERAGTGTRQVSVKSALRLTKELTLMVISAAAFGMRLDWKEDGFMPRGHTMTFKNTLGLVSDGLLHRLALPDWALNLYSFGRQTRIAYEELQAYMQEMIENRMSEPGEHEDLFSNLLRAYTETNDDKTSFSSSDLMGNVFVLLFAGHETSANTLALALAALAVYPDVQKQFREQVLEYSNHGEMPSYSDLSKLSYGMAIIYETLRLIPTVPIIVKESACDTQFTAPATSGHETRSVNIPAGTGVVINTLGLHYNPKHWEEPYEFKPERFLGEWNKHAWLPFSAGPRACLGRRFAEIEMLTAMALMVLRYEIRVRMYPGETIEECRRRVLDVGKETFILQAKSSELVFIRR